VPSARSTGDLDGRRAGVAGEVGRGGEPRRPSGAAKQPPSDDRPDANGLGQPAGQRGDRVVEPLADHGQPAIQSADLSDQVQATCLRARSAAVNARTPRSSAAARSARSLGGPPPGMSSRSSAWSWLTLGCAGRPGCCAVPPTPPARPWRPLAAAARRRPARPRPLLRRPHPGRRSCGHAHPTAPGPARWPWCARPGQSPHEPTPLGEVTAQSAGVLDRPAPLRELSGPFQQLPIPGRTGRDSEGASCWWDPVPRAVAVWDCLCGSTPSMTRDNGSLSSAHRTGSRGRQSDLRTARSCRCSVRPRPGAGGWPAHGEPALRRQDVSEPSRPRPGHAT
jgi:hypothetical protein